MLYRYVHGDEYLILVSWYSVRRLRIVGDTMALRLLWKIDDGFATTADEHHGIIMVAKWKNESPHIVYIAMGRGQSNSRNTLLDELHGASNRACATPKWRCPATV
jgi:hypothetical protein